MRLFETCPFCKSKSLIAGKFETGVGEVYQPVECQDCRGTWNEVYMAAFRAELEAGQVELTEEPNE